MAFVRNICRYFHPFNHIPYPEYPDPSIYVFILRRHKHSGHTIFLASDFRYYFLCMFLCFFIGCVFILYFFIKNAPFISFHLMLSHFFKSVIPMFGIAGLFAITDFDFRFDYLFPLWPILIQMALLFLIALIADFIKSR